MVNIYLDNAATTRTDIRVLNYMKLFLDKYGNPSSLHSLGRETREEIENSRKKIANFLKARTNEIIFTSSGSEANNLALKGIALRKKGNIITAKIEHSSILKTCRYLENFINVKYLNVDKNGFIDVEELKNKIDKKTILVSIQ